MRISETAGPIGTESGTMMPVGPLTLPVVKTLYIIRKLADGRHFENC